MFEIKNHKVALAFAVLAASAIGSKLAEPDNSSSIVPNQPTPIRKKSQLPSAVVPALANNIPLSDPIGIKQNSNFYEVLNKIAFVKAACIYVGKDPNTVNNYLNNYEKYFKLGLISDQDITTFLDRAKQPSRVAIDELPGYQKAEIAFQVLTSQNFNAKDQYLIYSHSGAKEIALAIGERTPENINFDNLIQNLPYNLKKSLREHYDNAMKERYSVLSEEANEARYPVRAIQKNEPPSEYLKTLNKGINDYTWFLNTTNSLGLPGTMNLQGQYLLASDQKREELIQHLNLAIDAYDTFVEKVNIKLSSGQVPPRK